MCFETYILFACGHFEEAPLEHCAQMKRYIEEIHYANEGSIPPNARRVCGRRKVKRIPVSRVCPNRGCTLPYRDSPSPTQTEAESAIPVEEEKSTVTSTFDRAEPFQCLLPLQELMDETELERDSNPEFLTQEYYLPQFTPINAPSPFSPDVVRTAAQSPPTINIRVKPVRTTLEKPCAPPPKLIIPDIIIHSPSPSFSPITPEALDEPEGEQQWDEKGKGGATGGRVTT